MDKTREECDPRSPKRQAQDPDSRSAGSAVAALDDAIWTSIVEFMPIPKDLHPSDKKNYDATVSELAALLHPRENAVLWRRLLLQSFDFSTDECWNVENENIDDAELEVPSDEEEQDEDEQEASGEEEDEQEAVDEGEEEQTPEQTIMKSVEKSVEKTGEQNPQLKAMRGRYHDMPSQYLEENLVSWGKLGIYHRPSQYGFLTTLQQTPPEGEWPEPEDPFTLFGDLVHLLQLPHGDEMKDHGEHGDPMFKYLAAPAEASSKSAFHRFYVMKTLGYVPHFWHWGSGIGKEWKGFIEPDEFEKAVAEQKPDDTDGEEDEDWVEDEPFEDDCDYGFPGCSVRNAKRLYHHIHQHCRDWRSVCCNSDADGFTPVFSVGESKAAPHRWTGYVGQKCWT